MEKGSIASPSEIGRRIKRRLDELDMEQQDLARKVGVSNAFISRLCAGQSGLKLENIQRVARGLDMDFFNLIRCSLNEEEMEAAITQEVRPIIEERLGPDIGRALVGLLKSPPPSEEARRVLVWVLKQNSAMAEAERDNGS
jgi:transcriptional regulator with XRE-family HTH domain